MRGHAKSTQSLKVRVSRAVQGVGEKSLDRVAAEYAGRKADGVDDHKRYGFPVWPLVAVGGDDLDCLVEEAFVVYLQFAPARCARQRGDLIPFQFQNLAKALIGSAD